jgi:hypothetical protein
MMIAMAAGLMSAVLQQAAEAAVPKGPWILTCDVASPGDTGPEHRIFRVGPKLFQEWKPDSKAFGYNMCSSFTCRTNRGKLEGQISSPSVVLTITLDPKTRQANWRTLGASGTKRTSGPCTIKADPTGGKGVL